MGLEPTTLGTTIQCSNQLSYIHRLFSIVQIFCELFCATCAAFFIYPSPKSVFPEPKSTCPAGNLLKVVTQINIKQLNCAPE